MTTNEEYIKQLEDTLGKFLTPLKDIPFAITIKVLSGCEVLTFDKTQAPTRDLLEQIMNAAKIAGTEANRIGIFTARPNEAGNHIEPFVKTALTQAGLRADTPVTKSGKRKATGYPDIEIELENGKAVYIECKTYNL